jgi:hypothetical protein
MCKHAPPRDRRNVCARQGGVCEPARPLGRAESKLNYTRGGIARRRLEGGTRDCECESGLCAPIH